MGLIVCKNCGKRISDTVDDCIHCGAPINDKPFDKENAPSSPTIESAPPSPETPRKKVFTHLGLKKRLELEMEFLESDKWAKRYQRDRNEMGEFGSAIFVTFGLFMCIGFVGRTILTKLNMISISNSPPYLIEFSISFIALGALLIGMFIYSIVKRIYYRSINAKYVYMKKFQRWLNNEKNIEYFPPLKTIRQQMLFDNIDLDKLSY